MMTGHVALPALHGDDPTLPATLSPRLLVSILREELGFSGPIISDALDMGAIGQGLDLIVDTIAASVAGVDLLLLISDWPTQNNVYAGLRQAARRGLITKTSLMTSVERILGLKQWLAQMQPPSLEVVGCAEHRQLANQIAARSITLVRDEANLLPLRLKPEARVAVILPQPVDLTPADISSQVKCMLAEAVRRRHANVTEFITAHHPTPAEIAALREQGSTYDLIIISTINAYAQSEQPALVNALLASGVPLIAVALRMPYDLQAYPTVPTYLCSYSILEPSMEALAQVLWAETAAVGTLPVSIPGMYPCGHRLKL
jgi:beta-N-acetylhexosaminidase